QGRPRQGGAAGLAVRRRGAAGAGGGRRVRLRPHLLPDPLDPVNPQRRSGGLGLISAAMSAGSYSWVVKVTKSYWSGLVECHDSPDIPRTNNDLEHLFGSHRYHERRASGRKQASPGLVVQGSVRVVASLATRLRPEEGLKLRTGYVEDWRRLRADLDKRRESRRLQRRFRHDPAEYLRKLEKRCLAPSLPS